MTHGAKQHRQVLRQAAGSEKEDQGSRDKLRLHRLERVLTFIMERCRARTSRQQEAWLDSSD
jgi:hypothetical protein